jgi:hypothetical protein
MNYYNHRNSLGRFTRRVRRADDGRFAPTTQVVAGRLYDYRGATVRALKRDSDTGTRLVSFHKTLFGFVKDKELKRIPASRVKNYLSKA